MEREKGPGAWVARASAGSGAVHNIQQKLAWMKPPQRANFISIYIHIHKERYKGPSKEPCKVFIRTLSGSL